MTISVQVGLERPQLIPVSVLLVIYLIFSSLVELFYFISTPLVSRYSSFITGEVSPVLKFLPYQYAFIFVTGIVILLTNTSRFVSRRRLSIAAYLLISGSIIIPLTQYYTPLSLLITFSLESLGFPQANVVLYYHLVVSALIMAFLFSPVMAIGTEIFLKPDKRIQLAGMFSFLAFAMLDPVLELVHILSSELTSLGSFPDSFIIYSLPLLLALIAYVLLAIPFLRHLGNTNGRGNYQSAPRP